MIHQLIELVRRKMFFDGTRKKIEVVKAMVP